MEASMTTIAKTAGSTLRRSGEIKLHDTSVHICEEHVDEPAMKQVFRALLARLRARGFALERDPGTLKNYPSLADRRWYGRKGSLEVHAETAGRMVEVEFFQNLNIENPNGGRYDFDKLSRMPRPMRFQCVVEMTWIIRRALDIGYSLIETTSPDAPLLLRVLHVAERRQPADLLGRFNKSWTAERFRRSPDGWPTTDEVGPYHDRDRDRVPLRSGDERYFRHRGRLVRSLVWGGINGQWLVDAGYGFVSGHELFSCDPETVPRRFVPGQIKRLEREVAKAMEAKNYARVTALGRALERVALKEDSR